MLSPWAKATGLNQRSRLKPTPEQPSTSSDGSARRFIGGGEVNRPLVLLLAAYLVLGSLYSAVTPIFEASDELWHYPMVKYLADHVLALPVQDPAVQTAWRQEGSQPPLYYMLGAALTFWIDTADLDRVRRINPHADIGVVVPDGNYNMIVHDPSVESFPWRGTVLAVHLVRLFSVALGAVTVYMTYRLTRELFPEPRWLALAAAAFTAFNPMFLFISGSVNNDNLSNALASVLLVMIVRLLKRTDAPSTRELTLIGVLAGAGMLAKFNIGFLLPLIGLALAINAYRVRNWRPFVRGALVTGALTVLIAGWWYVRNAQLYGDMTGLNMFIRIVGPRTIPANLPQLWSERHTFLMSYWGFFGGVNVPLPDPVYTVFNAIAALAALGLVIGVLPHPPAPSPVGEGEKGGEVNRAILLGRAVTVIWIVVLFVSLLRWTSVTWASQGRLMFSAIAPLSMWMAVGLWQLGRPMPQVRWRLAVTTTFWFVMMAALALSALSSAYDVGQVSRALPHNTDDGWASFSSPTTVAFKEPDQKEPSIKLIANTGLNVRQVRVGEFLSFELPFVAIGHVQRDWSIFIHLENDGGVVIAQRDVYPRQGLQATSQLSDDFWYNRFSVFIPDYACAPQMLRAYLGFYDLNSPTSERMIALGPNVTVDNRVLLGTVQLLPRDSNLGVPNPMSVNFGGEAELVGYDVSSLVMHPGSKVTITLYWRAMHPLTTDYRVFAQILEPNTTRVFGGDDAMPAAWTRPTTTWKPGEIIKDEHTFAIFNDAAPGTWQIVAGMYQLTADNNFQRLRIITPDGGEADDFVSLSRVKITPVPPSEMF
jgi:4-amino-4-deoxy-L-arabinose transferase-like glycosyltransferase